MKLVVATIAVLAGPASAFAAGPTLTMREVPLQAIRSLQAAPPRFNMVALHWRGSGSVSYTTRSDSGRWTPWRVEDDDNNRSHSWRLGNIVWVGASTAIHFRTTGSVTRLRAYYVWSPP